MHAHAHTDHSHAIMHVHTNLSTHACMPTPPPSPHTHIYASMHVHTTHRFSSSIHEAKSDSTMKERGHDRDHLHFDLQAIDLSDLLFPFSERPLRWGGGHAWKLQVAMVIETDQTANLSIYHCHHAEYITETVSSTWWKIRSHKIRRDWRKRYQPIVILLYII